MEDKIKSMFVPYEMAVELKEMEGYCPQFGWIRPNGDIIFENRYAVRGYIFTPLWQQVTEWLRDKHNIYLRLEYNNITGDKSFDIRLVDMDKYIIGVNHVGIDNLFDFDTYESALEEGIKAALTYIKQKK